MDDTSPRSPRSPRYTTVYAAGSWHVYDTHRAEPVAFSASPHEAHTSARAAAYNHYWHLTLEDRGMTSRDTQMILRNQAMILSALSILTHSDEEISAMLHNASLIASEYADELVTQEEPTS